MLALTNAQKSSPNNKALFVNETHNALTGIMRFFGRKRTIYPLIKRVYCRSGFWSTCFGGMLVMPLRREARSEFGRYGTRRGKSGRENR